MMNVFRITGSKTKAFTIPCVDHYETQYLNWITDEMEFFREGAGVVGNPGRAPGESLPLLKQ